jgi:maltose alpha-D-glucosyltransferase/alpha-amylase
VWSDTGEEYKDIRLVFPDFEDSNWEWDEVAGQYYWHRFFRSQPDLNFDNPKVHEEMLDIVRFWLDMGVDGFRLDAVIYLYEREGTDGAGLPETHEFIRKVRKLMDDEYSDKVMIAEANDMPAKLFDYFGEDDECHMCFHFPIMPRFYLSLLVGNKMPLVNIIRDTPTLFPKSQWLTFLRNHDELTLEMVTDDEAKLLYRHFAPQPGMKINNGIRRRLAPLLSNHKGRWLMLNAMLMSLVGTPIIYYGDEIGMGDNIDLPDRHGVRTAMQWNDGKNGGFSTADDTYFPVNSDDEYGYKWVNVAKQENDPNSYLNATRYLLTARKQHPELQQGTLTIWDNDDPQVFGYWREWQGERTLCVYNLSAEVHSVSVHLPDVKGQLVDLLHEGTSYMLTGWSPLVVKMRPFGSHWLYVKTEG